MVVGKEGWGGEVGWSMECLGRSVVHRKSSVCSCMLRGWRTGIRSSWLWKENVSGGGMGCLERRSVRMPGGEDREGGGEGFRSAGR